MSRLVTKSHGGATFQVVDPATYPYGETTFDEDEPIHEHWAKFGKAHFVLDVGASFGSFTLPALARGAFVIAVEPSTDGNRILYENVEANGWEDMVDIMGVVLWDDSEYPKALHDDVFGRSYPAKVTMRTHLDYAVEGCRIDAIKLDIEGAELGVLQGGIETLKAYHPTLLIEDHDGICPGAIVSDYPASIDSSRRIHSMLHDLGYTTTVLPFGCGRKYIMAEVR